MNINHNSGLCGLLPHHSPEVVNSLWEGSLSSDVSPLFSIDLGTLCKGRQANSAMVIGNNVIVTVLESVLLR